MTGEQRTLYPLEIVMTETPISLQAGRRSRDRWKGLVQDTARERIRDTDEQLGFLDRRPLSLTIYYFPRALMEGDIDNIVKPIMDALVAFAYLDDRDVERVVVQRFEPASGWLFRDPSRQLAVALSAAPPVVYVRVDDDLSWRRP
ncbi:RusA family crossover junction endodeoxyribonuclease [uncultured Methylobacterium sp.]|jgi:crossover junction endodeoxyribonuclease RusA|uniref:RusA family crossover junction endodeoxyribonuclease n=1 Tax=uncultured Methylobacterium sp. TaxID=157278 RepID=UPI002616CE0A|nr:RusA family crossover junction endodeoxyribonuclease [uncultured Methylobacterium sp.]